MGTSKEDKAAMKAERAAARERLEERRKHMTRQERFNSRTIGNRFFPEKWDGAPDNVYVPPSKRAGGASGVGLPGQIAAFRDKSFFMHRLTATMVDDLELVPDTQVEVITGQDKRRITATRVGAGLVIAGPLGGIIGAVARKQSKSDGILTIQGSSGYALIEFKGEHEMGAREFAAAVSTQVAQLRETPSP